MRLTVFQPRLIDIDKMPVPSTCPCCGKEVYLLLRDKELVLVIHYGLNSCWMPLVDESDENQA